MSALALIVGCVLTPVDASAQTTTEAPDPSTTSTTTVPDTTTSTTQAPSDEPAEPTTSLPFATTVPPPLVLPTGAVDGSMPDPAGTPPPPLPTSPESTRPGPVGIPRGLALAIALGEPADRRVSAAIAAYRAAGPALAAATQEHDAAQLALADSQAAIDRLTGQDRDAAAQAAEARANLRDASVAAYVVGKSQGPLTLAIGGKDPTDGMARRTYFESINTRLHRSADTWERRRRRVGASARKAADQHGRVLSRVELAADALDSATRQLDAARAELDQASAAAGIRPSLVPGIPDRVLDAYVRAAQLAAYSDPGCRIRWWAIAAIGRTESGNAGGRAVGADGAVSPPVVGPVLDGSGGFMRIDDSDDGALDGDPTFDRAVGPMQFIPTTWRSLGQDATGDGVADPQNIYDAAYSTARYLCAAARPLTLDTEAGFLDAAYSYSHSSTYPGASWNGSALYRLAAAAAESR